MSRLIIVILLLAAVGRASAETTNKLNASRKAVEVSWFGHGNQQFMSDYLPLQKRIEFKILGENMRNILPFFFLLFVSFISFSQSDSTGIYLNIADFQKRKLSYVSDCQTQKRAIKLGSIFNSHEIILIYGDKKLRLNKSDVFGYRDCAKKTYRFHHDTEYRIVCTSRIFLYFKEQGYGTGKNSSTESQFFFSISLDSEIVELTVQNLKEAYLMNEKFKDLLDISFKDDNELSAFDHSQKRYKVIRIYEESLKWKFWFYLQVDQTAII